MKVNRQTRQTRSYMVERGGLQISWDKLRISRKKIISKRKLYIRRKVDFSESGLRKSVSLQGMLSDGSYTSPRI